MKANINGIQVEGTPEEIYQLHELMRVESSVGVNITVNEDNKQDVDKVFKEFLKKLEKQSMGTSPFTKDKTFWVES